MSMHKFYKIKRYGKKLLESVGITNKTIDEMTMWKRSWIEIMFEGTRYCIPIYLLEEGDKLVRAYQWYLAMYELEKKIVDLTGYSIGEVINEIKRLGEENGKHREV